MKQGQWLLLDSHIKQNFNHVQQEIRMAFWQNTDVPVDGKTILVQEVKPDTVTFTRDEFLKLDLQRGYDDLDWKDKVKEIFGGT